MVKIIKRSPTKAARDAKWRRMQEGAKQRGNYIEWKFSTWVKRGDLTIEGTTNYWTESSMEEFYKHNFKIKR